MKSLIFKNISFFLPYFLLLFASTVVLASYSKSEIHIFINQQNNTFADYFFKYITHLGDLGVFAIGLGVILAFYSYRSLSLLAAGAITSGIIVQIIKNITNYPRPSKFFAETYSLHLVDGVKMYSSYSFPSGHSASAFSIFLALAFLTENKLLKFFCFLMATLVAFSRVYLSQHFLLDITIGSIFGVLTTLIAGWIFLDKPSSKLDNSLISLFKKNESKNA